METKYKNISVHVKLVYIFYYAVAACLFLAGVSYMVAPNYLKGNFPDNTFLQAMSNSEFIIWGGVMILLSALEGLLAFKLSRLSKVAKIIALIISILGFIWALIALFTIKGGENIFFLVLHAYFIWTFIFRYNGK